MRIFFITLILVLLHGFQLSVAGENHEHKPPKMPAAFDSMKRFIGTWEGNNKMDGKEALVTVEYELTSGGTAIKQTTMPGSPMEMVTMYHKDGDSLGLTHYCALGNQPYMKLKKNEGNVIAFEMTGSKGIESKKDPHMHGVTLTLKDENTLSEEWVYYEGGKESSRTTFVLKKK